MTTAGTVLLARGKPIILGYVETRWVLPYIDS
jgi:hypothetical protein